jgi:WD40 repeat protein
MVSTAFAAESDYDLFLSYNSADHGIVGNIARRLRDAGLKPFLDRWYLAPGVRWRPQLEQILSSCKAVAIFVGPDEMGSWQQREVDVALDLQSKTPNFPVIPVLLPGCEPPLGFLRQLTWVDLRSQVLEEGIPILAKAARGKPPGPDVQTHFESVHASVCPYRGLLYFREEDAPFFFGRDAAVDKLCDSVRRQPFVAVVGASGSGKSSVVRAGLVPRLRADRRTAWETLILVPTDQPLKALARALVQLLEPTMREVDRLAEALKLAEHFRSRTISVYDIVERILERQSGTDRLLIVVDQFEELYTLTSDEEARRRFVDELLAASSRAGSKANVALTLRGDFVGRALAHRPLSDRLQDAQINLGPMTREELECAICKPAEKIQLEFEPGLVRRILNDVGDEPGNLPLLEFVLKELWEKRHGGVLPNETYDAIGGLQGAVATRANEFFTGLSSAEQKILQRVFLRIVRPSESGQDTRRRAAFGELPDESLDLVVKLANERLLVTNRSAAGLEQTVEVAHEALISNWGTLRAWVNEDREFLLWRERLGVLLKEWERAKENVDALLRGLLLIEAQKWFNQRSQDLSNQERNFITASQELRERLEQAERERQEKELTQARQLAEAEAERAEEAEKRAKEQKEAASKLRRHAIAAAGAAVAALVLLTISVILWRKSESAGAKAEQQARIAEARRGEAEQEHAVAIARQLAAQAELVRRQQPAALECSVLLAVESMRRLPSLEADQALRSGLALLPKPLFRLGHDGFVQSLAFSPSGARLATANGNTIHLWDVVSGREIIRMYHSDEVTVVAFASDGDHIASASRDKTARVWDATSGREIARMPHGNWVTAIAFSPDGKQLLTGSNDCTARLWDASSGREILRMTHDGAAVNAVAFSPDGYLAASASGSSAAFRLLGKTPQGNAARVWETGSGREIVRVRHTDDVVAVTFAGDGEYFATGSADRTARIWETATGRPIASLAHEDGVRCLAFSPDGQHLATGSGPLLLSFAEHTARVWEKLTGREVVRLVHQAGVNSVVFSSDGTHVLSASQDGTARLWDAVTAEEVARMGCPGVMQKAVISPNGQCIASAGGNAVWLWQLPLRSRPTPIFQQNFITNPVLSPNGALVAAGEETSARIWNTDGGREILSLPHELTVVTVGFSPNGKYLATTSNDLRLPQKGHWAHVWELPAGREVTRFRHEDVISGFAFNPEETLLATACGDETRVFDVSNRREIAQITHRAVATKVGFSRNGKYLVTATKDRTLCVSDPTSGRIIAQVSCEIDVTDLAFSPDSEYFAASGSSAVFIWETTSGREMARVIHGGRVTALSFSPDSRSLAIGTDDKTACLTEVKTGREIVRMTTEDGVDAVLFCPDGRYLATSENRVVRVWELPGGREIARKTYPTSVNTIAFTPDGKYLIAESGDLFAANHAVDTFLWRPADLVTEACARLTRNLTPEEWRKYLGEEPFRKTCPDLP